MKNQESHSFDYKFKAKEERVLYFHNGNFWCTDEEGSERQVPIGEIIHAIAEFHDHYSAGANIDFEIGGKPFLRITNLLKKKSLPQKIKEVFTKKSS